MWICRDCGSVFDWPVYHRWTEHLGNGILEPWCVTRCPECGGEDLEEDFDFDVDEEGEIDE